MKSKAIKTNRRNQIALPVTAVSLALIANTSVMQQANAEQISSVEDRILVTANRSEEPRSLSLSSNVVITSVDIERLQAKNVSEILDQVAGMSVTSQGGPGQASFVFTRGSNSNQTLLLIDGVRVNSATLGLTDFSQIAPQQIERIEIIKGPRSSLWGSDAIGGVIQIFTKHYSHGSGNVGASIGSHGYLQGFAGIGFGNDDHNLSLSVNAEQSDGFNIFESDSNNLYDINEPDEDGFERMNLSVNGESYINDDLRLELVGRYQKSNNEYDASYPDSPCWNDPSQSCPAFYANEQDSENSHIKLASVYETSAITSNLSLAIIENSAKTFGNGIDRADGDEITTKRQQVAFINQFSVADGFRVNLGLDWYNEEVSTNQDKDPWTEGFQEWQIDSRDVTAVFVQGRQTINSLILEGAVRYDDIEKIGDKTTYNLSAGYKVSPNLLVSLNRGTGFKAPSFNDLYWPGSGNPDLEPEEASSNELLVRYSFDFGQLELAAFDSDIDNLIAWAPNEFGLWQPSNVNEAKIKGIESTLELLLGATTNTLAVSYTDAKDAVTDADLIRRPALTANYTLGYEWRDYNFTAIASYRDKSYDSGMRELPSFTRFDLGVQYQVIEDLQLDFKVNNIFDREYQTVSQYVADGINGYAGVTYKF
ncbi:TonB-dependent receptor domain-containing protein [Thalassotalea sp. PS06]|uniref:TonB-dependent receptor domain-containing protein n=1 Tax=Thalassotalea sp. PS06 TaxID=2594005 RepID=UPI001162E2E8|nr:TonB-dependent receptor [Thalassotalea sp. PS06]QDP00904.1 TonB-dependent receptor [Thalassotalea sp. PS06]